MKTAPKKIYLEWYRIGDKKYRDWCIIPKTNDEPVEYVCADAFVEKAIKFFAPYIQDNSGGYDRANVIENFRNYIEGE